MPIFQYTATDQTGAQTQGNFEAANEQQAYQQLAQYGLNVSQVVPLDTPADQLSQAADAEATTKGKKKTKAAKAKRKKKKGGLLALEIGGGPNSEDISVFTRQMSTLVQAGLPLLRSLEVMIKQQEKKPKFKSMLEAISEKVSSGGNLSDGLAMYPKVFDNLYVNMVRAGEAGGVLDLVLDRLAQFQEKSIRTIKKVKSAMIYPS
ncbi:MAG: type II secretion system F family protein, partial [Verrucomicrobiota bacterium]|nr:type II secretion system F family protein [Verrucomicrobiota bacterium]